MYFPAQFNEPGGWELQNMLVVARVMVDAALQRQESRGVHLRTDFPEIQASWQRRIAYRIGNSSVR